MLRRWFGGRVVAIVMCMLGVGGTAAVAPRDHAPSSNVETVAPADHFGRRGRWNWPPPPKRATIGEKPTTVAPESTTTATVAPAAPTSNPGPATPPPSTTTRPRRTTTTVTTAAPPPPVAEAPPATTVAPATTAAPATTSPPSAVPNGLPAALAAGAWNVRDLSRADVSLGLPPGWGLDHFEPEVQRYRDKGVTFRADGLISLDARSNDPDSPTGYTSGAFTSGWLPSQQKVHRGDYVQAAMKLPGGSGMWPALWLLDVPTPDANRTHEIDIMEAVGREPGIVYHTIHFNGQQKQVSTKLDYTQWHTYGVYLGADATYFYVDGRMVGTTDAAPASIEYGVKANLALGGSWAGNPDPAAFPAQVLMTPIRVWTPA